MEETAVAVGILVAGIFLVVPIWVLVLLYSIRSRQDALAQQHEADTRHLKEKLQQLRIQQLQGGVENTAARVDNPDAFTQAPLADADDLSAVAQPPPAVAMPPPVLTAAPGAQKIIIPLSEDTVLETEFTDTPPIRTPDYAAQPPLAKAVPMPASMVEPPPEVVDSAASRALRAAWSWLVVGEEYRRPGESIEAAVATNWLIRIGVLVLVVGIGFFLKYSIDKGLLGPQARVAMCFLGGAGLVAGGVCLFGKRYHLLGQGLVGTGLATLYFAVFAATGLFHFLPVPAGFVLMAFVTLTAGILAVRYQTVLLAVLGALGGYLTPVMLASGERNDLWLFGYLLLLALGVTGVAWRQRWPALTYLGFVCHNLVFFAAVNWVPKGVDFGTTMPFFAAYFVVFTTAVFLPCLTRGATVSALEPIGLFLTAAVFFYGSYELVQNTFSKEAVAWVTIGMAAYYTGHVYFLLQRAKRNQAFLATFLALAAGALTLTLPLLLSKAWLTMSWSVLALVAMWTALKLQSSFLRGLALALQMFVVFKLGALDFAFAYDVPLPSSLQDYWPVLLDRAMQFGVPAVTFWLSSRLLGRLPPAPERTAPLHGGAWGITCLVAMYALAFLVLNLESYRLCGLIWKPCQVAMLTVIWVGFGLHFLMRRERLGPALCAWLATFVLFAIAIKFFVDFGLWQPDAEQLVYDVHYRDAGGWLRLLDVGVVVGYLTLAWQVWRRRDAVRVWALASGYTALGMLFLHLTFETATFSDQYVPGFRGGSVSVLWGLYAFALIISGIWWQIRTLRYLGLGLFVVVVAKIFLVDLERLASIYRIAAFVALGVVLLLAAFVYLRQSHQVKKVSSDEGMSP